MFFFIDLINDFNIDFTIDLKYDFNIDKDIDFIHVDFTRDYDDVLIDIIIDFIYGKAGADQS